MHQVSNICWQIYVADTIFPSIKYLWFMNVVVSILIFGSNSLNLNPKERRFSMLMQNSNLSLPNNSVWPDVASYHHFGFFVNKIGKNLAIFLAIFLNPCMHRIQGFNNGPFMEQTVLDHLNTKLVCYSDPHSITFLQYSTHSTRLDETMVKFDLAMIIFACC